MGSRERGGPLNRAFSRLRARPGAAQLLLGYFSQIYSAVVAVAFAPFILRSIGPEAYGLVGLFLVAQAWFQLVDAGLTPAMTRESARFVGGAVGADSLRHTLRGLESVVLLSALPLLVGAWAVSETIATRWVQRETLSLDEIVLAVNIIAAILVIRWVSGVRRGLLVGFERHGTVYTVNLVAATLRSPGIVVWFHLVDPSVTSYFLYQLAISVLEALLLWTLSGPTVPGGAPLGTRASVLSLRGIAPFALNHSFLALIWILITQTDKLLLSRALPLAEFGYFTLAAAAAAGINLIVIPISQMLMPRLSRLRAADDTTGLLAAYRRGTRVAVVFAGSFAVLFAAFGHEVMLVWTGDPAIATLTGPVLAWYAVGYAAMTLGAFAYYLQYALGDLRLHTWGTGGFLIVIVPALLWATDEHGMVGAAVTWAGAWIVYLLSWVTITHRQLLNGGHWRWLFDDVLRVLVPLALGGIAFRQLVPLPDGRLALGVLLCAAAAGLFAIAAWSSGLARTETGIAAIVRRVRAR